MSPPDSVKCE